jgi:hypothetical protein
MFKLTAGTYPLGVYRIVKCEVCNKKMAVFDNNRGVLAGEVIVLYACSLLGIPLPPIKYTEKTEEGNTLELTATCAERDSCYACPLKKGPDYVNKR